MNIHYLCCWTWQDNSENLKLKEFKFLFFKSALAAGWGTTLSSADHTHLQHLRALSIPCTMGANIKANKTSGLYWPGVPQGCGLTFSLHAQSRGSQCCIPAPVGSQSFMESTVWYKWDASFYQDSVKRPWFKFSSKKICLHMFWKSVVVCLHQKLAKLPKLVILHPT